MASNDKFELLVKVKATGDELSLQKVMDSYEKNLGSIEKGVGGVAQAGGFTGLLEKILNPFTIGLGSAVTALYKFNEMVTEISNKRTEVTGDVYKEAQDEKGQAQFLGSDARTLTAFVNSLEQITGMHGRDIKEALTTTTMEVKNGEISGVDVKDFHKKDSVMNMYDLLRNLGNGSVSKDTALSMLQTMGFGGAKQQDLLRLISQPELLKEYFNKNYNALGSGYNAQTDRLNKQGTQAQSVIAQKQIEAQINARNKVDSSDTAYSNYVNNKTQEVQNNINDVNTAFSKLGETLGAVNDALNSMKNSFTGMLNGSNNANMSKAEQNTVNQQAKSLASEANSMGFGGY